ncbi:hypothetical protein Tco_1563350 [Tanacetum coccineum]
MGPAGGHYVANITTRKIFKSRFYWPTSFKDAATVMHVRGPAFRTTYKSPTGSTPFRIVYGKACYLPIEIKHKAYWTLKNANLELDTAGKHRGYEFAQDTRSRDGLFPLSFEEQSNTQWSLLF